MRWSWRQIGTTMWNLVKALIAGKLMLRLKVDKYFPHILWLMILFFLVIFLGMKVENTLVKVEKNKREINELKIYHAQKTVQLATFGSMAKIEELLESQGSQVTMPEKPANTIEK